MSEEIFSVVTGVAALVSTIFVAVSVSYVALKVTGWIHQQRISKQEEK